ncbi:D-alanyl-D-alanine carboxypeptidase PBP3 [Streptococcus dentapri]|uniref:serine-type D-Ala-D-Ala carboxypeptidase n=1 Tax=Streptococcus dentapri TaxID=573564 RepID=A0ABV8D2F7_9STRE
MKKFFVSLLIGLAFLFVSSAALADEFNAEAEHAIAVETTTGKVLYEKDATTPDGIASITKILTVYMVYKQIDAGKLSWDTKVEISDYAYSLTTNSDASNVPMENRKYTVKELVEASMIASANSAAIALAEKIAGSEPDFVDRMQTQLKEWGIQDAKLVNASGLNNSYLGDNIYPGSSNDDENQMSARDVAIIAQHLIKEYPEVLDISKKTTADFHGTTMNSFNYMLKNMPNYRAGVDGLKTGTTELAGQSFVATSTENGMRVISVIMNADHGDTNDYARFEATNKLLDYVAYNFQMTTLTVSGSSYHKSKAEVIDGKSKYVPAVTQKDFKVVTKIGSDKKPEAVANTKTLTAEVKKRAEVGKLTYKDPDLIGSGYLDNPPSVTLVAQKPVKKSFFLKVWWNHFVNYVNEKL